MSYQSNVLEKNFNIVYGIWGGVLTKNFEINNNQQPATLLCWQLTAEKTDGKIFQLNGDGAFPTVIQVPDTVLLDTVLLIDEGVEIAKSEYKIEVV